MQIKTLEGVYLQTIAECLNQAFADYLVPVYMSVADLARKFTREHILPKWSIGLFDGDQLVGFMLHGKKQKEGKEVLYNAGTGILPSYRGQAYTEKMYAFLKPKIQEAKLDSVWLEVIDNNVGGRYVYEKIGFKKVRTVDCFRGEAPPQKKLNPSKIKVSLHQTPNWKLLPSFWDYPPTWQNDLQALQISTSHITTILAHIDQQELGYLLYSVGNNRVDLLAVNPKFRRQGIGQYLWQQLPAGAWSMINVDRRNTGMAAFLKAQGWEKTISQYEMVLK